ncbi:heme d1 biosynthesis radical SAM protein NirJ [Skermanella rosea]|uniref:heme d1 biosynthesis radical SAM protein NirJ n=1 Tax=Skermanella rosea TaxID=1817965 RepID=UPI0019325B11|nr:heme d1 biosynthesis radical SAM protein NirJ [Skermanella rosea]UEM06342.1 heme d1 biosynthesis radical SAM protein NirJ [Skermanella rosea]
MFRLSQFIARLRSDAAVRERVPAPDGRGVRPVVIWNLVRRCNLTCLHCYAHSADHQFPGELTTAQALEVLDDLKGYGVPALILSGGEPLLRTDLFELAAHARPMGMHLALSTNGTLIDDAMVGPIAGAGFDYVGISLDGLGATHDRFRRRQGAFEASLRGIRLCRDAGLKVGVRFTLTRDNAADLPGLLDLTAREGIDKFYLSHLNFAGRGNTNRGSAAMRETTRRAMDLLFERALADAEAGSRREYVTGNNDADGVYFLHWASRRFPGRTADVRAALERWGGNATGIGVANIDSLGNVHPDTMWATHTLGNVKERPFSEIWAGADREDPIMAGLRSRPRAVGGRCGTCGHLAICNGNTRTRALRTSGDVWGEDPGCYLTGGEIGTPAPNPPQEMRHAS